MHQMGGSSRSCELNVPCVVNFKRHRECSTTAEPVPPNSVLPALVRTMRALRRYLHMISLRAYLPTGAKWTCAARIQRALDPQRTSLARWHVASQPPVHVSATEGLSSLQLCNLPCSCRSRFRLLVFALPAFFFLFLLFNKGEE